MRCRICRTARNLKYTTQQLNFLQNKDKNKSKLRLPLSAIPQTTGNICIECDQRLQNFQLDDGCDVVDVDSNGFHENRRLPVETSIIVDDDERLFDMFYKTEPVQAQSIQSLGSDGDAEVIELLTSRETTPDTMTSFTCNTIPCSNVIPIHPTVIDVIDLEDYDETDNVRNEQSTNNNKTASSDEKETRLLGCLNLVSSDSESEINFEPCPRENSLLKIIKESPSKMEPTVNHTEFTMNESVECTNNNNNLNCINSSVTIKHNLPVCDVCGISCLDKESLQVHVRQEHKGLKCLVCESNFQKPLDLVNHMRQKHRSYDGTELCEGARCSQDSAMTIRLRFMQRFTFYECQLCGLIESQFKTHKAHIMQKHADESKSLRDPMMKAQLKCPSCHQVCGTHQIDICRHLITKHEPAEGNKYLKETTDSKVIGLNLKYLQNLQQGTRFLTLGTHNQIFFECLLCRKVFGTSRTMSQHLSGHNIDDWKEYKAQKLEGSNTSSAVESKRKLKRKTAFKSDTEPSPIVSKKDEQPLTKKPKLEYETPLKNVKTKKNILPKDLKSKSEQIKAKKINPLASMPSNNVKSNSSTHQDITRQKKLKHKLDKKSLQNKKAHPTLTKVKVKPPLRHFPTQKYNCKHCQFSFKGFRKLQLHLLNTHRSEEYHSCENCTKAFVNKATLDTHLIQNICRRKRKCSSESKQNDNEQDCDTLDENFNRDSRKPCTHELKPADKKPPEQPKPHSSGSYDPIWLKELLQLSREKKLNKNMNLNTAIDDNFDESFLRTDHEQFNTVVSTFCRYCGKLFNTTEEFSVHEKNHIAHKEMPWIHFSQINIE